MLNRKNSIVLIAICVLSTLSTATHASEYDWSTYQKNSRHTGYLKTDLDLSKATMRWQNTIETGLNPVVVRAEHVIATTKTSIYDFDSDSGKVTWSRRFTNLSAMSSPAVDENQVYFQIVDNSENGYLKVYDLTTGEQNFKKKFSTQWLTAINSPTVFGDMVFTVCGYDNGVCAYQKNDGELVWSKSLDSAENWCPAVAKDYVITFTNTLNIFNKKDGNLIFSYKNSDSDYSAGGSNTSAVVGDLNDIIYISNDFSRNSVIRSVSLNDHKLTWEKKGAFQAQPVVGNSVVYTASNAGDINAYSEINGTLLWTWKNASPEHNVKNMILTNNVLLVGMEKSVIGIDLTSQKKIWTYNVGGEITLKGNTLYISSKNGKLTAVTIKSSNVNPSIDVMYTETWYDDQYYPRQGNFDILSMVKSYHLSDGTSWESGAGTGNSKHMKLKRVMKDLGGNIHYFFEPADKEGIIFNNTDYDSGNHSARGSLSAYGNLEMVAFPDSKKATLYGFAKVASNEPTYYKSFNYYSAKVGAIVPFQVTYTLMSGVWTTSTFKKTFSYKVQGEVDFAPKAMRLLLVKMKNLQSHH